MAREVLATGRMEAVNARGVVVAQQFIADTTRDWERARRHGSIRVQLTVHAGLVKLVETTVAEKRRPEGEPQTENKSLAASGKG